MAHPTHGDRARSDGAATTHSFTDAVEYFVAAEVSSNSMKACILKLTLRYMHLAPSALREAIALLNFGQPVGSAASAAV